MEAIVFNEILKAYGLPITACLFIGYAIWQSRSRSQYTQAPRELHAQIQFIRDKVVKIEAILEDRK